MQTKINHELTIEPPKGFLNIRFADLWEFRELLYFLIWRDIKVRYKQTILGALWAIIQPVMTMVMFSIIFGRLANVPTDGIPYPIFSYTALLPWQLFSRALNEASGSLVSNQNMITKTYFPRIFLPAASVVGGLVDFGIAFLVLIGMMIYYNITLTWRVLLLPGFLALALITALAAGLWLSALNVRFRDIKYVTPFLIQFWLYGTPIAYATTLIPSEWQLLYGINPLVGVVDGFRWAMLGQDFTLGISFFVSLIVVILFFLSGLVYFQRMESTFADLV